MRPCNFDWKAPQNFQHTNAFFCPSRATLLPFYLLKIKDPILNRLSTKDRRKTTHKYDWSLFSMYPDLQMNNVCRWLTQITHMKEKANAGRLTNDYYRATKGFPMSTSARLDINIYKRITNVARCSPKKKGCLSWLHENAMLRLITIMPKCDLLRTIFTGLLFALALILWNFW